MAIYDGTTGNPPSIIQWNLWGSDNFGKIKADGSKFFYLKDHLGSIRAIVDEDNALVYAKDYDCWGYPMEGRSWQLDESKYKFTSKERDMESNYDYFSAIGRKDCRLFFHRCCPPRRILHQQLLKVLD